MKRILIGAKSYLFPSHWNEFTTEELLFVSDLFLKKLTKEEFVIHLTVYFTKLHIKDLMQFNPVIFSELEHQFDFFWNERKLTKNLLPEIKIKLNKYYGPEEEFANMNYEQFIIFAESYFNSFIQTKDEDTLNLFIASLYTKEKNIFIPDNVEIIAKNVSKLSESEKTAILFFYEGTRNKIATRFPKLFPKSTSKENNNSYDFLQIIELLNNSDVSKNNEIKKINIYEIFTRLTNIIKEDERQRNNKTNRSNK